LLIGGTGNQPTQINGDSSQVIVEGVKSGVNIDLGGGRDYLSVYNPDSDGSRHIPQVNLPGHVNIDFGPDRGDGNLYVVNHQRMIVKRGSYVGIYKSDIYDLRVHGTSQADWVQLSNLRSRGRVWVYGGGGSDTIMVGGKWTNISGSLLLASTGGPNVDGRAVVTISSNDGSNHVNASTDKWMTISGPITITTGTRPQRDVPLAGDVVKMKGIKGIGQLSINTEGDDDLIDLAGLIGDTLYVDGGLGQDSFVSRLGPLPQFTTVSIVGIEDNQSGL